MDQASNMDTNVSQNESDKGLPADKGTPPVDQEVTNQSVFLPIAILMIAVLTILAWNLYLTKSQTAAWQKQFTQREQMVSQSRAVQGDLQKIAFELMSLSATDADARALVDKYQIRQQPEAANPTAVR
jgi:biopolymer transport protein ExbB/TolQ